MARSLLRARSAPVVDPVLRKSMLERVVDNRLLLELARELEVDVTFA